MDMEMLKILRVMEVKIIIGAYTMTV